MAMKILVLLTSKVVDTLNGKEDTLLYVNMMM